MKKNNVDSIPNNILYQFDKNRYIWKVKLNGTREGNYAGNEILFTEVYQLNGNNILECIASGTLFNGNDDVFSIFDYDKDDTISFKVGMPITEAPVDIMYLLKDAIERNYKKRKGNK